MRMSLHGKAVDLPVHQCFFRGSEATPAVSNGSTLELTREATVQALGGLVQSDLGRRQEPPALPW